MPNLAYAERARRLEPPWADDPHLLRLLEETAGPEAVERIRGYHAGRTPAAAAASRESYSILTRSVARLAAAGARIVVGPDTGLPDHPFGYAEQRELELLVEAGMTPTDAIVAATARGAEYLGRADLGTLVPGSRADFLVLDADPLQDIRNTRRISAVHIEGRQIDRPGIAARLRGSATAVANP
jgi:imidazolonepropionase-like amidohydrolase